MIDENKDVKTNVEDTSSSTHLTEDGQSNAIEPENSQASVNDTGEEEKDTSIDYDAELKRLRESRDREKEIARHERRKRQEAENRGVEAKEDVGLQEPDLDQKLTAKLEAIRLEQAEDLIDEELDALTDSTSERALIREIYDHRISNKKFNRRSIQRDLKDAKLLANSSRFESQLYAKAKQQAKEELRREQSAVNSAGGSSTRREPKASGPALNAEERALLDFAKKAAQRGR